MKQPLLSYSINSSTSRSHKNHENHEMKVLKTTSDQNNTLLALRMKLSLNMLLLVHGSLNEDDVTWQRSNTNVLSFLSAFVALVGEEVAPEFGFAWIALALGGRFATIPWTDGLCTRSRLLLLISGVWD